MSAGFKLDGCLCVVLMALLNLWPSHVLQEAVKFQQSHGYVAGWGRVSPW